MVHEAKYVLLACWSLGLLACTTTLKPYTATTFPDKCGSAIQCYNLSIEQLVEARSEIKSNIDAAIPIGTVVASADEAEPPGWLRCDGSEKDIAKYPILARVLKNRYGTAPPGKFKLPDYRGYFLRGWDPGAIRDTAARTSLREGAVSGRHVGSVQMDNVGAHTHGFRMYWGGGGSEYGRFYDEKLNCDRCVSLGRMYNTENNPTGETRPKNVAVDYLIRADH